MINRNRLSEFYVVERGGKVCCVLYWVFQVVWGPAYRFYPDYLFPGTPTQWVPSGDWRPLFSYVFNLVRGGVSEGHLFPKESLSSLLNSETKESKGFPSF